MKPSIGKQSGLRPRSRRLLLISTALVILAVGGLLLSAGEKEASKDTSAAVAPDSAAVAHRVVAYYFHTTMRCSNCLKIEAYTKEAIQAGFAGEIEDGRLVLSVVNIDEAANKHFVKDYQLFTKSVVLVREQSGRQTAWKNLPKIWELLGSKPEFIRYVQTETRAFLEDPGS